MPVRGWMAVWVMAAAMIGCGERAASFHRGTPPGDAATANDGAADPAVREGGASPPDGGNGDVIAAICTGADTFISMAGELPAGVGVDVTYRSGCPGFWIGHYSEAFSYTGGGGEGGGVVKVVACDESGSRRIELSVRFDTTGTFDGGTPTTLGGGSLTHSVDNQSRSLAITAVVETRRPVANWALVIPVSSDGVGGLYQGSFVTDESQGHLTGTFSVCHVLNRLPDGV